MYTGGGASPHRDPVGFGGQWGYYTEWETGPGNSVAGSSLLLLTYRYYDPATGRFVNRDPIGYDGGMNLYTFAGGNPVNRIDPMGTDAFDDLSNFLAGGGDSLTMGATEGARRGINRLWSGTWDDLADSNSTAYFAGEWLETGAEVALTLGSATLKKAAAKTTQKVARAAFKKEAEKLFPQAVRAANDIHHINPLAGHPVNLTKGKVVTTPFPLRGLPAYIHSNPLNLKLFPRTPAGHTAHMAAHSLAMKVEAIYTKAILNPLLTGIRAGRNLFFDVRRRMNP